VLQWVPFLSTGLAFASFITGGIVGKISFLLFPQRVYQLFALCGGILVGLIYELVTKTALVMLFLLAGKSFLKFSLPALILALILGIGTLIGLLIGNESLKLNSLLLGIAIASICYVAIVEIILKAIKNLRGIQFLTHFILGFIIVSTYLSFI